MGAKTFFGWLCKLPLILLVITTLGVGIYAAMGKIPGFVISWGAPGFIALLLILYLIGAALLNSDRKQKEEVQYSEEVEVAE